MIKWVFLDIDGVLTDGCVYVDQNGKEQKRINYQNIDAVFEFSRKGFRIVGITSEKSAITNYFKERFPWDYFYDGCVEKVNSLHELKETVELCLDEICFVGDSKKDIPLLKRVALAVCPQNAVHEVKDVCDYVLNRESRDGALWDLVDYIENINSINSKDDISFVTSRITESSKVNATICSNHELLKQIIDISDTITSCLEQGKKILIAGNGGSASDAQHIAAEFVGRFKLEREAFNVEALNTNSSILTAIGNDYCFESIFSRQIEAKGNAGDTFIAISTSSSSPNIIKALRTAYELGLTCILFTGEYLSEDTQNITNYVIRIPSINTPRIQESHIAMGHIIAEYVENKFAIKRSREG